MVERQRHKHKWHLLYARASGPAHLPRYHQRVSNPFLFLLLVGASYRIARFIALDSLPLIARPRAALLRRWGTAPTWAEGLTCLWCIGLVVSAALVAGVAQVWSLPLPGLWALATSTAVGILARFDDG